MTEGTRTSRVVAVERIRIRTARPFAEAVRGIEAETGMFDAAAVLDEKMAALVGS